MTPLKPVQVASWQMHAASARAAFQGSTCARPWSKSEWTRSTLLVWFAPFASRPWQFAGRWCSQGTERGGTPGWGKTLGFCSLVTVCRAVHGWGMPVGPASHVSHLLEETPSLVPCWDTSVFLVLFPPKDTPCPCPVPHQYSSSLCYLSFIFQRPCLLAFLRRCLALHWLLLLMS